MNAPCQNIVFLATATPHRARALELLRRRYQDAQIIALEPPDATLSPEERACVDECLDATSEPRSPWLLRRAFRRAGTPRPDLLVLPFEGIRYRLLACVLKPVQCVAWTGHPAAISIPVTPLRSMAQYGRARCRGLGMLSRALWSLSRH